MKNRPFYEGVDGDGNEIVHKLDAKYLPCNGIVTLALKRTKVGDGPYEYELIAGSYQEAVSAFSSYMPVAANLIAVINLGGVENLESKPINALYNGGELRLQDEYNDIVINPDNTVVLD